MIKRRISGALLLPMAAVLAVEIPAAIAQDALPEAPAALRDFKLEPEPPAPKPQPLPPADPGETSPATPSQTPNSPASNSNTQEPPQIKAAAPEALRIKAPSAPPAILPRPEQKPAGAGAQPQVSGEATSVRSPTAQNEPQTGAIGEGEASLGDSQPQENGVQVGEPEVQKAGVSPLANDLPWRWILLGLLALAAAIGG